MRPEESRMPRGIEVRQTGIDDPADRAHDSEPQNFESRPITVMRR